MNKTKSVFEIHNLECAYDKHPNPVLFIKELQIPNEGITTILGKSGSGKSTFVETLGMMNHTIRKGSINLSTNDETHVIDSNLWKNPEALSSLRRKYFSFIFQNDYLMPYYTPLQNILIGNLIQNQASQLSGSAKNAKVNEILKICTDIGLDEKNLDKMPYDMSGGQRQRLSFIRAITKDYSVIFGDEPTGNLDDDTSERLMLLLKESVEQLPNRSAVLVSHNIRLSITYSNRLIVLSPTEQLAYAVEESNVFDKVAGNWQNKPGQVLNDSEMVAYIREMLRPNPVQN
jgi:putative ABC transport system ATP-binding protein